MCQDWQGDTRTAKEHWRRWLGGEGQGGLWCVFVIEMRVSDKGDQGWTVALGIVPTVVGAQDLCWLCRRGHGAAMHSDRASMQ